MKKRTIDRINPGAIVLLLMGIILIGIAINYGVRFLSDMSSNVEGLRDAIDQEIGDRLRESTRPVVISSLSLKVEPYKTKNIYLLVRNEFKDSKEFKFDINCRKSLWSGNLGGCGAWIEPPFPVTIRAREDIVLKIPLKAETERQDSYLYEITVYTDDGYARSEEFYVDVH